MNKFFYIYVTLGCLFSTIVAQEPVAVTTLDGDSYSAVKVVRVHEGKVILSHSGGIASVDLANLPKSFRETNGLLPGLDETKALFRGAVNNWIEGYSRLNSQYERALKALEEKLVTSGDKDKADTVKVERESFRRVMQSSVSEIEELAKLQNSYRKYREKWDLENSPQLPRIVDSYRGALQEVVNRNEKEKKFDEANLTKQEIARFSEVADDSDRIQILLEMGPAIVRVESSIIELSPDGNPSEKHSGTMAVMAAGPQTELVLPIGSQSVDVVEMEGNWETWAVLKKDGSLVSSPLEGDGIPEDHKPVVWFRVGSGVVLAFHPDGSYSVYGEANNPADNPPDNLQQITQLEFDRGSGIALSEAGKIRVWGKMYSSDEDREAIENQFESVRFVGASENVAWAVDENGDVFSWRKGQQPKKVGHHDNITSFGGGRSDYLVLLEAGTLEGGSIEGGENPIVHVPENLREGKAIRVDGWGYALQFEGGSWITWGGPAESSTAHMSAKSAGALLDLEISAAPGSFMIMMLRRG